MAAFLQGLAGTPPIETHISAIFRGTDTVWKLKKAVRLGFLDFTACADRARFLRRELALNAPYVPGMYRDVVPILEQAGGLRLGDADTPADAPVRDWVLRMQPVPPGDFLDVMAEQGRIDAPLLTALADTVAAMHASQPAVGMTGAVARMRRVIHGNAAAARAAGLDPAAIREWTQRIVGRLQAGPFEARAPLIRRAHGDLHLGNLILWHGRPAPFDALEFDEELATIDPGYDLAFLLMDLDQRVGRPAANQVLNRYVARTGDVGLVRGLPVFLSLRAMVRAHVAAARGLPPGRLLAAALDYLRPSPVAVVAVGGLMGTGKSTLARALAPALGPAPGALVLRSDELRKRLAGVAPEDRLPSGAYSPAAHAQVDEALLDGLRAAHGHAVVLDATFLDPGLRAAVTRAAGPRFVGVWLEAPLEELVRRVQARRDDASDADAAVLRAAAAGCVPPRDWLRVDARDAGAALQVVRARLDLL